MELLVTMVIASVLSSMVLMSWFALNSSYAYSVNSSHAREDGRIALARIQREVRDAEGVPGNYTQLPPLQFDLKNEPMILRSRPWTLVFTTTFNETDNSNPTKIPHLVCYRVYYDSSAKKAELWRYEDTNYDGRITGVTFYADDEPIDPATGRPAFEVSEKTAGEGRQLVLRNVVNTDDNLAAAVPAFSYAGYYDGTGVLTWQTDVRPKDSRMHIISVRIHILVDMNPLRSPVFADMLTNAQLRNARQF